MIFGSLNAVIDRRKGIASANCWRKRSGGAFICSASRSSPLPTIESSVKVSLPPVSVRPASACSSVSGCSIAGGVRPERVRLVDTAPMSLIETRASSRFTVESASVQWSFSAIAHVHAVIAETLEHLARLAIVDRRDRDEKADQFGGDAGRNEADIVAKVDARSDQGEPASPRASAGRSRLFGEAESRHQGLRVGLHAEFGASDRRLDRRRGSGSLCRRGRNDRA